MCVATTIIKSFPSIGNGELLEALFLYPKLVIFEGSKTFWIEDVEVKNEQSTETQKIYKVDHDIIVKKLKDHYLWLILKSGEILVTNILTGSQIAIKCDNYANYKMAQLHSIGGNLIFVSESGECLKLPFSNEELEEKFVKGTCVYNVSLEKTRIQRSDFDSDVRKCIMNGLKLYIDSSNIVVECSLTRLRQIIESNINIAHIVPWADSVVVANEFNMWIVNLNDSTVTFNFDNHEAHIYPLAASCSGFYYLLWNEHEIKICYAWNTSAKMEELQDNDSSNRSFTKSSQDILKSRMQNLVHAALTNSTEPTLVITQLKTFYDKIDDLVFLLENSSQLCQHDISYKALLHLLQKRVHLADNQNHINQLSDLIIKVDLLEYILFRGNQAYENINLFQQDYKQLCITFISKSDLDLASICWLKYSEMNLKVLPDDVIEILNAIPQNIKMSALIIWLRNFVPPLLDENPYFIDLFVKWTSQRVFLLEQSIYWPKIGLKFIDEILNVLEESAKTISVRPISMDNLDVLKDHINYIMELKEKYKVNLLLGEVSSQSPSEVALLMLRRCYTEDLNAFLQDYLPAYATRYLFELDDILRSFIETEAASCGGGIDSSRLKILIDTFRSPTVKLDCLLQVLKVLDVPWDDTVANMAVAAAASVFKDFTVTDADRVLAQEIQQELNYAKVKVILKKYNFPLKHTDYTLVLHKLIHAPTVDLNDLKVITSVMTNYANYGSVLYIDRCLRNCETRAGLNYFNELPHKEKRILLKTIMNKYEQIINGSTNCANLERNYLDFLKGTKLLNPIQTKDIESLYHLKNSYNISLNMNQMYIEEHCADKADVWINDDKVTASSGRGRCVTQLTSTHQSRHSELIALLRRISTSNQVRKLIESLITSLPHENISPSRDISTVLSLFKDGRNSPLLLETFDVLIELVTNCREEHVHYIVKYLSILNALINTIVVVKNLSIAWKFHYIFLPMISVSSTNDLIDFYCKYLSRNITESFYINVANKSDFIAFRVLSYAMENVESVHEYLSDLEQMKNIATKRLMAKVTSSQDLDEVLITSLLLILDYIEEPEDKFWIINVLQGHNDSLPPALLCYLTSTLIRCTFELDNVLPGNATAYPPQYVLKSKFNINLADMALPDSTEETWDVRVVLFHVLRQYPETTFERLVDLCNTLNVPINDGLSLQLISLLSTWELKYKIFSDDLGCRQLSYINDEKDIIKKCFTIWESINDKTFIKDILNDFWKTGEVTLHGRLVSINPYYYEVYVCIYYLIYGSKNADSRHRKEYFLLNFLKEYRRTSTPKQYEFELFSVKGMFPEIGHYRLPFHLFMREDMWSNLKSEITLETYESWLPAVVLLSLDADLQTAKDMICSNALKQTMTTRKRTDLNDEEAKDNEPWRLTTREEPLLRAAHRCVRHIANMEWAGACLFYVLQGCARGADQVAAAHLCYQFAQRWSALQPGNRAVRQMERLHSTLSTRHALHKIEWAREEFVSLIAEPAQLIRAMYLHPNFVEKMSRHDVNRAANEIADKNGINVSSIRIQMLENILTRSNEENKSNGSCGLDNTKLMTAKYILKATCPKMGAIYLSRIAFDDESDFNKCKKLRALQCLMSVVEPDTAVKVTNKERDALWSSLLELLYVVNLEDIDMPWLVATFTQDKVHALEQLLQAAVGNVEGLKLAADLARKFGNTKNIKQLISLLLRAGLYEEIIPLLLKISSPPDEVIYTAWRAVILSPFQSADYPITDRQKAKCLNAINLLPVCPIIKDEDLLEIWKNCVRCKCFGLGCLVLPYISPQKRQTITELQKIDRRNLIASLKNLHSETYLVSGAMTVLESMSSRAYR